MHSQAFAVNTASCIAISAQQSSRLDGRRQSRIPSRSAVSPARLSCECTTSPRASSKRTTANVVQPTRAPCFCPLSSGGGGCRAVRGMHQSRRAYANNFASPRSPTSDPARNINLEPPRSVGCRLADFNNLHCSGVPPPDHAHSISAVAALQPICTCPQITLLHQALRGPVPGQASLRDPSCGYGRRGCTLLHAIYL